MPTLILDRLTEQTLDLMARFNGAFLAHDPAALRDLVAEDCVVENTTPAPNGGRLEGGPACLANWQRLATAEGTHFEVEETLAFGDRAVIRWRYVWGDAPEASLRGLNLMRVRDGKIVGAMGYVKGA